MSIKKIRNYIGEFRAYNRERQQMVQAGKIQKKDRLTGRIVRYVHSIEKGLVIESPRPEFGYTKIKAIYEWIQEYLKLENIDKTCVYMAADALSAYCKYHDSLNISSEKLDEIRQIAAELGEIKEKDKATGVFGGTLVINKDEMCFDSAEVERFFKTRHSVRQFNKEPVSDELIHKAVELAQTAPSACNRQAVRTYVIDARKFMETYPAKLDGIGGFVESCDKIILVTGKLSPYEEAEYKQFIVSAGIFAGYLSLALHGLGLGACVVQRPLRPSKEWIEFCRMYSIPIDEQIVCMLTVGQLKEQTPVPLSKRFDTDAILKYL